MTDVASEKGGCRLADRGTLPARGRGALLLTPDAGKEPGALGL